MVVKKVLSVALIAATMVSGVAVLGGISDGNIFNTTVSAASVNSSNRCACLQNCVQTGNKQYETVLKVNATYRKFYIWRKSKTVKSIKSTNEKAISIHKDENGRYIRSNSADDFGYSVVTVRYTDDTIDIIKVTYDAIKTNYNIDEGQSKNYNYTGGKSDVKSVKVINGADKISAIKSGVNYKVTGKSVGTGKVKVIYNNGLVEIRTFNVINNVKCDMLYTYNQFMNAGVVYYQGKRFTYYSQSVLPGYGLNIPGRHVEGGYVSDKDGYIVLASPNLSTYPRYSTIDTPFGRKGKFYDFCPGGSFDVYVQ